jgi:hypothetical protein
MRFVLTITQVRRYYFLNKKTAKNFSRFSMTNICIKALLRSSLFGR